MKINRAALKRLQSAFAYAQKKLSTAYHFRFEPINADGLRERGFDENALMLIERTDRGDDDSSHFTINVNTKAIDGRSMILLRQDAGHEVLHAILFDLFEKNSAKNFENAVYKLQRIIFGEEK